MGQQLALSAAVESIVLLQNNDSALPLKVGDDVKTVAVIGPVAVDTELLMGGKSDYCPQHIVSLLEGLQTLVRCVGTMLVPASWPKCIILLTGKQQRAAMVHRVQRR